MKSLLLMAFLFVYGNSILNVSGDYSTDFGELKLTQTKELVNGVYSYPGENGNKVIGSLSGKLIENKLNFTWEQIQGNRKIKGSGEFVFSVDGKSFRGTWAGVNSSGGDWNGNKK